MRFRFRLRTIMLAMPLLGVALLFVRSCDSVPRGVDKPSAFEHGDDGLPLVSPAKNWTLRVRFNDGGAMHSGHHWTWIIDRDRYGREYVIAQGYCEPVVRYGQRPLPVRWIDNDSFEVGFLNGRYSASYKYARVSAATRE